MKNRYQTGGPIDEMEEANNRSMFTPRKVSIGSTDAEYENDRLQKRAMERSRILQQDISGGSDFISRPQDEGYRPNKGTARERATAEGAFDSGKIIESGNQGFGGPGSSRTVKAPKPAVVTKEALEKSGMSLRDYMNKQQGLTRRKEKTSTSKLIDPKNIKSDVRYDDEGLIDPKNIRKMSSGGMTSSASKRADGIAVKGKTRGKMC